MFDRFKTLDQFNKPIEIEAIEGLARRLSLVKINHHAKACVDYVNYAEMSKSLFDAVTELIERKDEWFVTNEEAITFIDEKMEFERKMFLERLES